MGLDEKFKSMIGEQLDIQGKLKPVERAACHSEKALRASRHLFQVQGGKSRRPVLDFYESDKYEFISLSN